MSDSGYGFVPGEIQATENLFHPVYTMLEAWSKCWAGMNAPSHRQERSKESSQMEKEDTDANQLYMPL